MLHRAEPRQRNVANGGEPALLPTIEIVVLFCRFGLQMT